MIPARRILAGVVGTVAILGLFAVAGEPANPGPPTHSNGVPITTTSVVVSSATTWKVTP